MKDGREQRQRGIPLSVRLAPNIHAEVTALAKAEDKSVTQMIEQLLGQALFLHQMRRKWQVPSLWYDVTGTADARGAQEAEQQGISGGDWSTNPAAFRAAMMGAVHRLLQLMPGEFDLEAESGGVLKARFEHALATEHYRRKGPQSRDGFFAPPIKSDAA